MIGDVVQDETGECVVGEVEETRVVEFEALVVVVLG